MRRLDPAAWPERAQVPTLAALIGGVLLASFIWPTLNSLFFWLYGPLFGALIWRLEHTAWRLIASWTVPLGTALLVAERLPSPLDTLAGVLGMGVLVAMLFWDKARDGWLHLVAPGSYRVFGRADRPVWEGLAYLDEEARGAIESYTRDGNDAKFLKRLNSVSERARGVAIADAEWASVRDLFVDWLSACSAIARDRTAGSEAFEEMDRRRGAYEGSSADIANARSHLI